MRCLTRGLLLAGALCMLSAVAAAAEPATTTTTTTFTLPTFPTPFTASIVGLSLTAIAVVGARATQRTSNTMMYTVLACVALTAVFVGASHRIYGEFYHHLIQAQQTAAR
jgi:hypothetical protein